MSIIYLMSFSLINLNAKVILGENNQGEITYIYEQEDQVKVEAALIELKEYRISFPLIKEDRDNLFESRNLWIDKYDIKIIDLKTKTIQRDVMIGSTVVLTVIVLILGMFK